MIHDAASGGEHLPVVTAGAVLWDLDGTLVDSEEYHWRAWRETMSAEGITLEREEFLATFGQRNDSILRRWLGSDVPCERMQRLAETKEECYRRLVSQAGLSPLAGAAEWVKRLSDEGWRQAIASSAPRLNIEVVLQALALQGKFQAIVSAEDVSKGKPDPEVFLTAAAQLGVPPSRTIVVEDAVAGIEAARRAGMRSIGLSRTGGLAADLVVSSLDLLPPDAFTRLLGTAEG
jgi:beta-phosphoglucomutase family hydrolase